MPIRPGGNFSPRRLRWRRSLRLGFPCPALAQRWPAQDIHFVTGTAAGSGGDVIVRYFAEKLRPLAGRTIIVENRVGALGGIATEYVARSKPDGYTILIWGGSNVASMMAVRKKPPIDVVTALQVAATINRQAFMFVVDAKMPYYTLADLTKAMLAKGDKASYATSNNEASVMGEIYKQKTGVTAVNSIKVAANSINDIFSGAVDYAIHNPVLALAQRNQGKMRILGVGASERFASVPGYPNHGRAGNSDERHRIVGLNRPRPARQKISSTKSTNGLSRSSALTKPANSSAIWAATH